MWDILFTSSNKFLAVGLFDQHTFYTYKKYNECQTGHIFAKLNFIIFISSHAINGCIDYYEANKILADGHLEVQFDSRRFSSSTDDYYWSTHMRWEWGIRQHQLCFVLSLWDTDKSEQNIKIAFAWAYNAR